MKILVLFLLLIFPVRPQSRYGSDFTEGLFEKYNEDSKTTSVVFKLYLAGAEPYGLMLEAHYLKLTSRPELSFISESLQVIKPLNQATPCKPKETLLLVLDGKPKSFQFTCRNGAADDLHMQLLEPSGFEDILIPLASADSVEGRVSNTRFKLNSTQIGKIRHFLKTKRSEFRFAPTR